MVAEAYPHLASPLQIGPVTVKNRIVSGPMGAGFYGAEGVMTDTAVAYHTARAKGGAGLGIMEMAQVHPSGLSPTPTSLHFWDQKVEPGLAWLADSVHEYGMKLFQQLGHAGAQGPGGESEFGRAPSWSASAVPEVMSGKVPVPMTKGMIDDVVGGFADAVARCRRTGFDGVEIHAAHTYLIHQFLSPEYNFRTDDYGGSLENRMRFLVEILQASREAAESSIAVGIRLSSSDLSPSGLQPPEVAQIAARLQELGLVDYVSLSMGSYHFLSACTGAVSLPRGYQLPYAEQVSPAISVPTVVAGRILTLEHAERIVADGVADMVLMVRGLVADAELVNKSFAGEANRVRPCIGCNTSCSGIVGRAVACAVNPDAGHETAPVEITLTARPRSVMVIGGGPAGMEAALTAARRGHRVTLCEAGESLGGQLAVAGRAENRTDMGRITDWLARELELADVEIRLGTRMTVESVRAARPDAVIVATGSLRGTDLMQRANSRAVVKDLSRSGVASSADVLADPERFAPRRCVIYDDLWDAEAVSVAETMLARGSEVVLATSAPSMAPQTLYTNEINNYQARLGADTRFQLRIRQYVSAVDSESVTITGLDTGVPEVLPAELLIMVNRPVPQRSLHEELQAAGIPATLIGDGIEALGVANAIGTGRASGLLV